jgi:hypothetical protein
MFWAGDGNTMKACALVVLLAPAALAATAARADNSAACQDPAAKGQALRDAHKLVEAREQFRVCAGAGCPTAVQSACAAWLTEVDRAVPTVLIRAKNGAGTDLLDVDVSVDGHWLVSKLDGPAVPVNAGPHAFHLEGADGARLDLQVVIREGVKAQVVAATLEPPASGSPAPVAASASPSTGAAPSSGSWQTVGWVAGAIGVVGLGVGAAFGISALASKSAAHCDVNNVCDPGTTRAIKNAALASDVGWIVGGVLLAGGVGLLLFAPPASAPPSAGVRVVPVAAAGGGGIVMGTPW